MKKAIVIGCPGSGKSTFSRLLRDKTNLPLYYLDRIWHREDKTNITREEFDSNLSTILESEEWIIDGNYSRTLEMRLEKCDTVFLFDIPTEICISHAESRVGKKREDIPWVEDELDDKFKNFILNFSVDILPHIYEILDKYKTEVNIIVFKSNTESDRYIDNL